jgi:hypothetical protein
MKIRKPLLPGTDKPAPVAPVEPNEGERRNGWTAASLSTYLSERESQQRDFAKEQADRGVRHARSISVTSFDPHNW